MKKTEAQKRAQAKYDKEHKEEFKVYSLKFGLTNPDNVRIVEKLANQSNKQAYIRDLILDDIKKNGSFIMGAILFYANSKPNTSFSFISFGFFLVMSWNRSTGL